jgi:aspartate/methionine/tyrosine aminotransferase
MANYAAVFNGMPEEFMLHLLEKTGIACIPPESFYSPQHVDICRNYVRFSFCKTDEALMQVKERLAKLTS